MNRIARFFTVALLTIAGLMGSSLTARADDHHRCERRIHQAEENLRVAVERHGENSRQARKRHEQLEQVRRDCHWEEHHDH